MTLGLMAHVPALLAWRAAGWYAIYRALRLAMPGQGALLLALARRRFSSIGRRTKQYLAGGAVRRRFEPARAKAGARRRVCRACDLPPAAPPSDPRCWLVR